MPTQLTACSLPGCSEPIIPGRSAFRLGGYPGEYHDRGCMNIAFELLRKGKKFAKSQPEKVDYVKADERQEAAEAKEAASVKVKAEEFGGAEVYRRYCDNPACKGPVTVCWKGRRGEYCSNNCLKTEKEKNIMADETNESPIAAGTPATKKGKGKKRPHRAARAAGTTAVHTTLQLALATRDRELQLERAPTPSWRNTERRTCRLARPATARPRCAVRYSITSRRTGRSSQTSGRQREPCPRSRGYVMLYRSP